MKLTESKIRSLIKVKRKSHDGKVLYGICPKCGKDEFGISLEEGHLFGCFRKKKCGFKGNIFDLYKFLGLKFQGFNGKFLGTNDIKTTLIETKIERNEIKSVKMPIGFRRVYKDDYLEQRGFLDVDFKYYLCGYTKIDKNFLKRVIIGIKYNDILVGYLGRTLIGDDRKYVNSKNPFSNFVDGLQELEKDCKTVILVEGLFDRIVTRNNIIINNINACAICTFGSNFSERQVDILLKRGIENIYIFYDPDILYKIKKNLTKVVHLFKTLKVMIIEQDNKDPADLNPKEFVKVFNKTQNFITFTNKLLLKEL